MFSIVRRIGSFLALNFVLMLTFYAIINLLPVQPGYYGQLVLLYGLFGFGGAFVSLLLSRWSAKRSMGVKVIDPKMPSNETEKWLLETVHNFSRQSRFKKMPEVGIYQGEELNAFATGPSKSKSLVAVSTGLLNSMTKDEVEGVLAHEIAHIKNGDMVTMVLLMGTINTLVMIVARILSDMIISAMSRDENGRGGNFFMRMMLYQAIAAVLGILGTVITSSFSRRREFRADAGGARLAGREKMTNALIRLQNNIPQERDTKPSRGAEEAAIAALKISGRRSSEGFSLRKLLSTHPPLQDRIRRLQTGR